MTELHAALQLCIDVSYVLIGITVIGLLALVIQEIKH
jgi:hypothetical protein